MTFFRDFNAFFLDQVTGEAEGGKSAGELVVSLNLAYDLTVEEAISISEHTTFLFNILKDEKYMH